MKKNMYAVLPIYGAAFSWWVYALLFPLYRMTDLMIAAAVSCLVYVGIKSFLTKKYSLSAEKIVINKTGVTETDVLIQQGKKFIQQLMELNDLIADEKMSEQMESLKKISYQIFDYLSKNPTQGRQIGKWMDYYFPTTIKLLETYEDMSKKEIQSESMKDTMQRIETIMSSMVQVFSEQLDNLYQNKALDIKTDIDVLKSMLAKEGLDVHDNK